MTTLKDITWDYHKLAERQEFVKVLLSGKINPDFYAAYLFNQMHKYFLLEDLILANIPSAKDTMLRVRRANKITDDFNEICKDHSNPPPIVDATDDFIQRVVKIAMEDKDYTKLLAYVYVLHMGDLSGGQIIANKVPGEGRFYKFDEDTEILKDDIRKLIGNKTSVLGDEAIWVFQNSAQLFQELMELDIEPYLE